MDNEPISPQEREILMQEWSSTIHYWATDNSILWQRCSVFLLVNSIFFAPIALASADTLLPAWILSFGIPIFAIFINILWWLVTLRSVAVIEHFEQLIEQIRVQIPILRFYNRDERESQFRHWYQRVRGKKCILNLLPASFLVLWLIVLITGLFICAF